MKTFNDAFNMYKYLLSFNNLQYIYVLSAFAALDHKFAGVAKEKKRRNIIFHSSSYSCFQRKKLLQRLRESQRKFFDTAK